MRAALLTSRAGAWYNRVWREAKTERSMKLGKIGHIGIVVRDLEKAKEEYSRVFGIDKWYELTYDSPLDMTYRGEKRDCNVTLYFGGKGHTAIELIYTEGDDNIYTAFLARRGEGIHHIQYNVKDLDAAIAHFAESGWNVLQSATFGSAGARIRYAYVGKSEDDTVVELIETTLKGGIKKGDMPFETQLAALTGNYRKLT